MKKPAQQGFTLLELMATTAIVAIFAMIAIPGMSEFIKNERLTTQINAFHSSLQRARSEAILRHLPVAVCSSSDGASCTGSDWTDGWIVFVDTDNNGSVDAGEEILQAHAALEGGTSLDSSDGSTVISYDSRGFTPTNTATYSLCDDRGTSFGKAISIGNTGRVRKGGAFSC